MSLGTKIPRADMLAVANELTEIIRPYVSDIVIGGSLRREREMVGDIDLAISRTPDQEFELNLMLVGLFGLTKSQPMRGRRNGKFKEIQVNILDVLPKQFGAAVLMSTGSGDFNIQMRALAKSKGWKLSQYGLVNERGIGVCDSSTEEAIFLALGKTWREPNER